MSKDKKTTDFSKEVEEEIRLIIREGIFDKVKAKAGEVFGLGKTSSEKEAEDAEKEKEGESWLPIWKELKEPYHSIFVLYVKFMAANGMNLDTERKTNIAELFRDRGDSAVRVVGGEMCSVGDPWMSELKKIADTYKYKLPPNCLTGGGGEDPDPSKDDCPEGQVRDPDTGECVDGGGGGKTPTTGGDGPVPVFKDMRVKDPETGKMARVGAKEGGQGLQALLANWLAKNAPGEVDKKALQQAAGRLVKAVAAQLKANDIAIQENQVVNYVKSMLAEMSARPGSLITRRGEQGGSIDRGELKKMIQRIAKGKIGKRGTFKNLNVDAVLQVAMDFLRAEKFNVVTEAVNMLELADELMRNARLDDKTALRLAQALTDEFGDKELFGLKVADEKPEDDDFQLTPPEDDSEPEPEVEAPPVPGSSDQILDGFKKRIKKLDLDSTEGRYGASEPGNEQAYLGAYMLYKAMKNALEMDDNDVKYKQVMTYLFGRDWGTPDSQGPARVQGGTQKLKEAEQQDLGLESEVESWLRDMIQTFEREGLADAERAAKASKDARGVKEPKEKGYEPKDAATAAGTINTKQIVAPQLKSAGVDLNSPEGQKFAKNLEKVVRRFLKRHLQRLGKEDIKLIAENEKHMSKFVHIIQLYTERLLKERKNELQNNK